MSILIENTENEVLYAGGIKTNKTILVGGSANLDMSGSSGSILFPTGSSSGLTVPIVNSATVGATVALTNSQSGAICINKSTSGSPSWTLPVGVAGTEFTFICGNTTAGFTVTNSTQVIHFKTSASGTVLTSTTTLTNTQATAIVGDFITLVCDGTAWWMIAISGIFAAS